MRRILLGSFGLLIASQALAQSVSPENLVLARQAGMDLQFAVVGATKRTLDSKGDVKSLKDGADGIAKFSRAIPGLFPKDTEARANTKALPAVWSDRDGFEKAAAALGIAAQKLSGAAASGDQSAATEAFQELGRACSACHKNYRTR